MWVKDFPKYISLNDDWDTSLKFNSDEFDEIESNEESKSILEELKLAIDNLNNSKIFIEQIKNPEFRYNLSRELADVNNAILVYINNSEFVKSNVMKEIWDLDASKLKDAILETWDKKMDGTWLVMSELRWLRDDINNRINEIFKLN